MGKYDSCTELLRRKADKTGHVITVPLITDATGKKFVDQRETKSGSILKRLLHTKCTNSDERHGC